MIWCFWSHVTKGQWKMSSMVDFNLNHPSSPFIPILSVSQADFFNPFHYTWKACQFCFQNFRDIAQQILLITTLYNECHYGCQNQYVFVSDLLDNHMICQGYPWRGMISDAVKVIITNFMNLFKQFNLAKLQLKFLWLVSIDYLDLEKYSAETTNIFVVSYLSAQKNWFLSTLY